ncbi:jg12415 [Pararge aegeria aegeria]|uniref:Jg12415 protein n=1 Tax=Pararge aegeria aegeria TaxID=348720 RepID=A0A8S4R9Z8_9NEOP|nr:jg12415 [Pararge aegeria aegeria]
MQYFRPHFSSKIESGWVTGNTMNPFVWHVQKFLESVSRTTAKTAKSSQKLIKDDFFFTSPVRINRKTNNVSIGCLVVGSSIRSLIFIDTGRLLDQYEQLKGECRCQQLCFVKHVVQTLGLSVQYGLYTDAFARVYLYPSVKVINPDENIMMRSNKSGKTNESTY